VTIDSTQRIGTGGRQSQLVVTKEYRTPLAFAFSGRYRGDLGRVSRLMGGRKTILPRGFTSAKYLALSRSAKVLSRQSPLISWGNDVLL
jgi:hypothetical protein